MNVVIVGGGKVGFYLVNALMEHGHQASLIDLDAARCQRVVDRYDILTICGDGTELQVLISAGADRADALIAITGRDEVNFVCSQLAKRKLGIRRVVARCNNPKNQMMFEKLGIELTVSTTALIADLIEREIVSERVRTVLTFHHGEMTLVEMMISSNAPSANKKVRDLASALPEGCVLVSIIRGGKVIFPRGDTMIETGDAMMAVTHADAEKALRQAVLGEN